MRLFLVPTRSLTLPRICESHTLVLSVYVGKYIESSNVSWIPPSPWSTFLFLMFLDLLLFYTWCLSLWLYCIPVLETLKCCRMLSAGVELDCNFMATKHFPNESLKPRKVKRLAQVHLVCGRLILAWVSQLRIELSFHCSKMLSLCTHPCGDFCQKSY